MKLLIKSSKSIFDAIPELDAIVFVNDVNIATPSGIFASSDITTDFRDWNEYDFIDAMNSGELNKLHQIEDFVVLDYMKELDEDKECEFSYTFTAKQKQILSEGYKHKNYTESTQTEDVKDLIRLIDKYNDSYVPIKRTKSDSLYKNFAEVHNLTLTNLDYLAMVKQLEPGDFEGCIKSFYPDYLGDKIYQFIRKDIWYGKDHQQIGDQEYTLWIEINVRQTKDDQIIALISLHDAESDSSNIRDF